MLFKYGSIFFQQISQRSHKKQVKNKSKGDVRNKNRIKLITANKNFSKTFQSQKISLDIVALFIKLLIIITRQLTIFF